VVSPPSPFPQAERTRDKLVTRSDRRIKSKLVAVTSGQRDLNWDSSTPTRPRRRGS
jgi:hypothetical protein